MASRPRKVRPEVAALAKQAGYDLDQAEKTIGIEAYNVAAFLCQQSAEKYLKALALHRRLRPEATHDLTALAAPLSVPADLFDPLRRLTRDYTAARYPDAANGIPSELYTRPEAEAKVRDVRELERWVRGQIPIRS